MIEHQIDVSRARVQTGGPGAMPDSKPGPIPPPIKGLR